MSYPNGPAPGDDERLAQIWTEFRQAVEESNSLWALLEGGLLRGDALRQAQKRYAGVDLRGRRLAGEAERLRATGSPGLLSKAGIVRLRADPWGDGDPKDVDPVERLGWSLAVDVARYFGG